jgi:hypothetical protein
VNPSHETCGCQFTNVPFGFSFQAQTCRLELFRVRTVRLDGGAALLHGPGSQPRLFGEAPILRHATAVTATIEVEPIRVFGDEPVRGTQGIVDLAVCLASIE